MCLAEYRIREQTKLTKENVMQYNLFEMVPHWPGIISREAGYYLTPNLLTKESLSDHKGILRLAFEFPPIMLPRKVKS